MAVIYNTKNKMARLTILNNTEYNALYQLPEFTIEDRLENFSLGREDYEILESLDDISLKISYILQLGYFKAKQYFFTFTFQKAREDIWFIINSYYPGENFPKKQISGRQQRKIHNIIREKYNINKNSARFLDKLKNTGRLLATHDVNPKFILEGLLSVSQQDNVVRPAYSTLQDIVSNALKGERNRLSNLIVNLLDKTTRDQLDMLLEKEETLYNLTSLKKDPKDFSTREISKEVEKHEILKDLYLKSLYIMSRLKISEHNACFYADLVEYYPPARLKANVKRNLRRLYLICFVYTRYKKINDNLILCFIYKTNKYISEADKYQGKEIYGEKLRFNQSQAKAGRILNLFVDDKIPDDNLRSNAFNIVSRDKFKEFARRISKPRFDKNYYIWEFHQINAECTKRNIKPIFVNVDFACKDPALQKAVTFLKDILNTGKDHKKLSFKELPIEFFPKSLRHYYFKRTRIDGTYKRIFMWDRFVFSVYLKLKESLEAGEVYIKDSVNYRCLEDELIPKTIWNKDKKKLIRNLDNNLLLMNIEDILDKLRDDLNNAYLMVNKHIKNGENKHLRTTGKNQKTGNINWKLPYKKEDNDVNNPFYDKIPVKNINDVLHYVVEKTNFMKYFSHILPRYGKTELNPNALFATLTAKATGTGIRRMSEICDVELSELENIENNFLQLENLRNINVHLSNELSLLPIFKYYTLSDYGIHASIDGQKFETKAHTILARNSSKYFGFNKGVVAMTLLANNALINTRIIGANEYEGHYPFDMIYNNNTEINIKSVSGDMHSISRINFALLYLFGYRFMPRFTKLSKKTAKHLVTFGKINRENNDIIKPKSSVNEELIKNEWDNILRIIVSLAQKKTNQASMIRKFTSFDRSNFTYKAFSEFDKIIMSLYMLNYIDDHKTRKNVQGVLNRGESYHQIKSALVKTGDGKLAGKSPMQINISNECTALLASIIIYYNATILSVLYENYQAQDDEKNMKILIRLSPVAWQHINFLGSYEFYRNVQGVDIEAIIKMLLLNSKINSPL